jgi:Zn ribbon nucleic-acid-binding protein
MTDENYPEQPLVKREIATDWALRPCPACEAQNVFLTHTVRNLDARKHVECRICGMHGPVKTSNIDAVESWNGLPRNAE